jgi:hypothetical protein
MHWLVQGLGDAAAGLPNVYAFESYPTVPKTFVDNYQQIRLNGRGSRNCVGG